MLVECNSHANLFLAHCLCFGRNLDLKQWWMVLVVVVVAVVVVVIVL